MRKLHLAHHKDGSVSHYIECHGTDIAEQRAPEGGGLVELASTPSDLHAHARDHYVFAGQIVPKISMGLAVSKTNITANGKDEITLSGIPAGAVAAVTGVLKAGPETVTDGSLVLTSTKAGAINVTLSCRPIYFDWSMTFHAV
jgi:hypothetical protein